jgi:hypothetical protein
LKLGGQVATTAGDCTHFVAEKFQRTGNMLAVMAAGKPVVTVTWLESCAQASCFLEEKRFTLEDEKKEKELGFSMVSTLSAAQHKPLLQGIRVFITPQTNPKPEVVAGFVKAAGGQACLLLTNLEFFLSGVSRIRTEVGNPQFYCQCC